MADAWSMLNGSGVYTYRELLTTGSRTELLRGLESGAVTRLRRGWYALQGADPEVATAVRSGGVLSCMSALRRHEVWVPDSDPILHPQKIHVRGNSQAHRRRTGFCERFGRPQPEASSVDDVLTALAHAARCVDDETFVVLCDSILNKQLASRSAVAGLFRNSPAKYRELLEQVDPKADSGLESLGRQRIKAMGLPVRSQVYIEGLGTVDLLVGDRLIIEFDGKGYHAGDAEFVNDRRRDRVAVVQGYLVIRLTYWQVVAQWPAVERDIRLLTDRGDHLHDRHPQPSPPTRTVTRQRAS